MIGGSDANRVIALFTGMAICVGGGGSTVLLCTSVIVYSHAFPLASVIGNKFTVVNDIGIYIK